MVNMVIDPIITTAVAIAFRDKISNALGILFEPRQIRRITAAKAEKRFRRLDAPHLLKDVFEGRKFEDGKPVSTQQRKNAA